MGINFIDRVSYIDEEGNEKIIIIEKNKMYSSPPFSQKEFNAIEKAVGGGDFSFNIKTGKKTIIPLDDDDFKSMPKMTDEEINEILMAIGAE